MFPRNQTELLGYVGNSLRLFSRRTWGIDHLGVSLSTIKRNEKADPDHPKRLHQSKGRGGYIEMHARAYVLLNFAKRLELEGKPVDWAIRLLRSIIQGEALLDPPEADAA